MLSKCFQLFSDFLPMYELLLDQVLGISQRPFPLPVLSAVSTAHDTWEGLTMLIHTSGVWGLLVI